MTRGLQITWFIVVTLLWSGAAVAQDGNSFVPKASKAPTAGYPLQSPPKPQPLPGSDRKTSPNSPLNFVKASSQGFMLDKTTSDNNDPIVSLPTLENEIVALDQPKLDGDSFVENPTSESGAASATSNDADVIWWPHWVTQQLHASNVSENTSTDKLMHLALANSPRIRSISKSPLIRDLQIIESEAEFDTESFVRSMFEDRTDPVGNTLTTGGEPFLKDHIWSGEMGVRKKLRGGGDVEFGQKFGFHNSNSRFFVPQDQGTATLAINYRQPLLKGKGRYINQAQILIAQAAGGIAWDVFAAELQDEVQSVISSYWRLYYDRSIFLQKKRNVERGQEILDTLVNRQHLDSLPSQIARARSSVLSRKTDLANAFRDVRNAETEIRKNVAEPDWLKKHSVEILPTEHPIVTRFDVPLTDVVLTALDHRPEIKEVVNRARLAGIRCNVSENDLLPDLSLLFGTYVSALQGDSGVFRAWQDQFNGSTPGYSFGLEWEFPFRNRAARSRWAQNKVQLQKIELEINETIQRVIAESQIAHRRVNSSIETLEAAFEAIVAADADMKQQQIRWQSFALVEGDVGNGQSPTTILDQLLDAQERLNSAELIYSQALLELQIAMISLHRATGTLLLHQNVEFTKSKDGWIPNLELLRGPANSTSHDVFGKNSQGERSPN